jgi:hypothetical protein
LHGIPAERRAMRVSLFLTTFLAPHRVKASATPDQDFDPRHPRSRSDDRRRGHLFVASLRARGSRRQNSPIDRKPIRSLSPGQAGKWRRFLPARLRACPGLLGPGPHGPLWVNSVSGKRRRSARAGCLDAVAGSGTMFTVKAHLRKHRDLLQPPRDCPSQPGEVVGFATCTPVIGEVSAGNEGVGRQNSLAGSGTMFTVKAGLRKHRDLLRPPRDCPSLTRCRGRLCDLQHL